MLIAEVDDILVDAFLVKVGLGSRNDQSVRYLLLLTLFEAHTEIVHRLLKPWRLEVEVHSIQLAECPNVANIVVVFDFWLIIFILLLGLASCLFLGFLFGELRSLPGLATLLFRHLGLIVHMLVYNNLSKQKSEQAVDLF